jgi:hypothetical protein
MCVVRLKTINTLREHFKRSIDADIISICETHLLDNEVINVNSYTWFGFNRLEIHRNAPKGSGGVGLLLRNSLPETHNVKVVDTSYDGILIVKLVHIELKQSL